MPTHPNSVQSTIQRVRRASDDQLEPTRGRYRMNGINYGGMMFTYPVPIAALFMPPDAGLYVIQVTNNDYTPMPFQAIYFGQGSKLAEQKLLEHPRYAQWSSHPLAAQGLHVSFFPTGTTPETTRLEFTARLLGEYLPQWNPTSQARAAGLLAGD
jgi:hypothetical protein